MASIGENIKRLRKQNGWSQRELGEKIDKTRGAIWQYENGDIVPRMGVIEDLASVFGVSKSELVEDSRVTYAYVSIDDLSAQERELVGMFRKLPANARNALIVGLRAYQS